MTENKMPEKSQPGMNLLNRLGIFLMALGALIGVIFIWKKKASIKRDATHKKKDQDDLGKNDSSKTGTDHLSENFEPVKAKSDQLNQIIKRLSMGLMVIGGMICAVVLLFTFTGSLYDGIGPVKLTVLLVGVLFLLTGLIILLTKPKSLVSKAQDYLSRLALIRSAIPEETWRKIEPLRYTVHALGLLGIVAIYLYAISDLGFKGFGPIKLAAMGLCALIALFGFTLYIPPLEKLSLWLAELLLKIWHFVLSSLRWMGKNLKVVFENLSDYFITRTASVKKTDNWFKKLFGTLLVFLEILFSVLFFLAIIVAILGLLFLFFREIYLTTVPEPIFYKRLIRAILLTILIIVILFFSRIREAIKNWVKDHQEGLTKLKKRYLFSFLTAIFLIIVFFSFEAYFRIRDPYRSPKKVETDIYRVLMDIPYDYWTLRSHSGHIYDTELEPEGRFFFSKDYSSPDFNIIDHRRLTTDQPENPDHTIYLLGSNILASAGTPDNLTPASILQQSLNEQFGNTYIVENYGNIQYFVSQSIARLKTIDLQSGDIVVLIIGMRDSDILNRPTDINVYSLIDKGEVAPDFYDRLDINFENPHGLTFENLFIRLNNFLLDHLAVYRAISTKDRFYPDNFNSEEEINAIFELSTHNLGYQLIDAYDYAAESGAKFIVVLEPSLFVQENWSDRDYAVAYDWLQNNLVDHLFWTIPLAYDYLREEAASLSEDYGFAFYDLSGVFDAGYQGDDDAFYIAWDTLLPEANRVFTQALYDAIVDDLGN